MQSPEWRADGQVFSPPYLFKADGTLATRPTITVDKATVVNGDTLTIDASAALRSVAIVRFGSATHAVNTDQRRIELCGPATKACASSATVTVTVPGDPGIAIPGYWMVFGVDTAGVPSVATRVKIGATAEAAAESAAVVSPGATPTDAVTGGGTAAKLTEEYNATTAQPRPSNPPGPQEG